MCSVIPYKKWLTSRHTCFRVILAVPNEHVMSQNSKIEDWQFVKKFASSTLCVESLVTILRYYQNYRFKNVIDQNVRKECDDDQKITEILKSKHFMKSNE